MRKLREALGGRRRKGQVSSSEGIDPPHSSQPSAEDSFPPKFPDGLEVLHDCPNATIDICFVHGLTGDRTTTWTAEDQSDPWPKALLPSTLSTARILTYGYDAYVVRVSVAGSNRLIDHATNLLNDLTTDRDLRNASSRPIILVAHSLGGLVCKKAILSSRNNPDSHLRNIFNCTKGVIFMGTPHKGSWMADWAKISAGALGLVKSTNTSLLEILRTDNQLLEAIQVDFWSMIRELRENGRRIEVTCFFEELPLPVVGKVVVSKDSATLEGYNAVSIHANHRDMVRFSSANDNGFKRLLGELVRWGLDLRTLYVMNDHDRQCLKSLWPTDPEFEKIRIQQTKGGLLEDVYSWVLENPDFRRWRDDKKVRLLWIRGDPGKGKTMLVCGIIDELKKSASNQDLLSFFFCQATASRVNNATAVLRCLIRQLVDQHPSLISHIRKRFDQYEDTSSWYTVAQIFTDILEDQAIPSLLLVIDGLDECQDGLPDLLYKITQTWSSYPHVKWLVSSRSWPNIKERLDNAEQLSLELHAKSVSTAVGLYIRYKAREIAKLKKYDDQTHRAVRHHLSTNADGTFLWVALVCQYLEKVQWDPVAKMKTFPPGLDSLYRRMMQVIRESEENELCWEILGFMAVTYGPTTLKELASFSKVLVDHSNDTDSLKEAISLCGSFLTVREETVYFVHQSAKEFLTGTASNRLFPSGIELVHQTIFSRSLSNMESTLRRDIYSLRSPGFPIDKIERPESDPLGAVKYSCIYWIDHLRDARQVAAATQRRNGDKIYSFLREKYLYWLEALSLLDGISRGVRSMSKLEVLVQRELKDSNLINLVSDAHRFIRYWKVAIENSPLQVYHSALLFSPAGSLIRRLFEHEQSQCFLTTPAMEDNWSACLQTFEGHSGPIRCVAFSHDSTLIASTSSDETVKVWDAASGHCLQTLKGHSDSVNSVVFSHDSTLVASASNDKTVKIWDAASSRCLKTLKGHRNWVNSVAFSHNSMLVASASDDKMVKVWDAASGRCLQTFKGHSKGANSVAFSHNSTLVASTSNDETVKIWDVANGHCLQIFKGHSDSVRFMTFSHDSTLVASASNDKTVKIWDAANDHCLQTFKGHSNWVNSVAFSHNSMLVASASNDKTVKIWDATSGHCLQTFKGHSNWVNSVAFSHDSTLVASASDDETVKVWVAASSHCLQTPEDHIDPVNSVAFSQDSTLVASASNDMMVKIWDAASGRCLKTLKGHSHSVKSVTFSHDSTLVASASNDETVKIWDAASGRCLKTLEGHRNWVNSVAFSHDSTLVASTSDDTTVKIWDTANGRCLKTLEGHRNWVNSVAFSHDSTLVASASDDKTVKIWDAASGRCLKTLKGHSHWVNSVAFSHNSSLVASASNDETVKIWDVANGHCLQTVNARGISRVKSFDLTNSYLILNRGTIRLSLVSLVLPAEHDPEAPKYLGCGINSDRTWITWDTGNLLWLPPEYRPHTLDVTISALCIGCTSGRVLIFNIDPRQLSHSVINP